MKKQTVIHVVLAATIAVLLVAVFHLLGNTANVDVFGRSSFQWMVTRWQRSAGRFSYGYFIPIISGWLVWRKRRELKKEAGEPDWRGLLVIVASLLLQLAAARAQLPRLSLMSLIGLLWGIPWYLFGAGVARHLFFPCAYLLFCIPLTFLDSLTFPLRMFGVSAATAVLNGIGVSAAHYGTAIYLLDHNNFTLNMADPCSGLKYLLSLAALTAVYAYVNQEGLLRKWALFLSAIPLAIFANVIRVTVLAFVAIVGGRVAAESAYHDYSGYIVFISAVIMMAIFSSILKLPLMDRLRKWKETKQHPSS